MSPVDDLVLEVLETLEMATWSEAELFHKKSRSRHHLLSQDRSMSSLRTEEGWAVRAGDERRSFFYAASGPPRPNTMWPEADGEGLRLPAALPVAQWAPPSELDSALVGENEARALFEGLARELDSELPGARLLSGSLEDGSAECQIASSRGVRARFRQRLAFLRLEAVSPDRRRQAAIELPAREARRFRPLSLARRLADRLLIAERGQAPDRDRGEMLLAPALGNALVEALAPCWLGPDSRELSAALVQGGGKLGCAHFHLIDDGRLPGGLLDAPVDGEGLPTREVTLVEEGRFRQPLLPWTELATTATGGGNHASGCLRRPSWREPPAPGASHLYLRPDPSLGVSTLLEDLRRGYFLLDPRGPANIDFAAGRFSIPVCGFAIDEGQPTGSVDDALLTGSLRSFLHGILAVARDLTFTPGLGGMIGAPTLLVKGLELRRRP